MSTGASRSTTAARVADPAWVERERVIARRPRSVSTDAGFVMARRVIVVAVVLTLMSATPIVAAAPVVTTGPSWTRAVALTFDDGIGRAPCGRIARTLRARGAKGTFFINAVNLARAPAAWRRILKRMPVGNHTRSHPDLTRLSNGAIRKEIRSNEAIHERILGRPMLKVLRPPYGSTNARVQRVAASLGYKRIALWNRDSLDWSHSATASSIVARSVGARAGSIILLHCSRWATAHALPAIIRHYHARGIELAGLGRVLRLWRR